MRDLGRVVEKASQGGESEGSFAQRHAHKSCNGCAPRVRNSSPSATGWSMAVSGNLRCLAGLGGRSPSVRVGGCAACGRALFHSDRSRVRSVHGIVVRISPGSSGRVTKPA